MKAYDLYFEEEKVVLFCFETFRLNYSLEDAISEALVELLDELAWFESIVWVFESNMLAKNEDLNKRLETLLEYSLTLV